MENYIVKVLHVSPVTHDVKRIVVEKPDGYEFVPGQATEVAINKPGWEEKKRPFTFTSLADAKDLEFTIKIYKNHHGVTEHIGMLIPGDEIILHDVWGAISYKGKGTFIAGGAGITPFIAILRDLYRKHELQGNTLLFSNKTYSDIILKEEFEKMLGQNFHNILTREILPGYWNKRIDENYLKSQITDFNQHFYICGPEKFTLSIQEMLSNLGAQSDAIIIEK